MSYINYLSPHSQTASTRQKPACVEGVRVTQAGEYEAVRALLKISKAKKGLAVSEMVCKKTNFNKCL